MHETTAAFLRWRERQAAQGDAVGDAEHDATRQPVSRGEIDAGRGDDARDERKDVELQRWRQSQLGAAWD